MDACECMCVYVCECVMSVFGFVCLDVYVCMVVCMYMHIQVYGMCVHICVYMYVCVCAHNIWSEHIVHMHSTKYTYTPTHLHMA